MLVPPEACAVGLGGFAVLGRNIGRSQLDSSARRTRFAELKARLGDKGLRATLGQISSRASGGRQLGYLAFVLQLVGICAAVLLGSPFILAFASSIFLTVVVGVGWAAASSQTMLKRFGNLFGGVLVIGGFGLFMLPFLAVTVDLGPDVDYPVGLGHGFTTIEGLNVVSVGVVDRLQVYDAEWNF